MAAFKLATAAAMSDASANSAPSDTANNGGGSVVDEGSTVSGGDGGGGGVGKVMRKLSQWKLVKKKLSIKNIAMAGGGKSLSTGNPILIRTASKKSMTTADSSSVSHPKDEVKFENTYQLGPNKERMFRPLRVHREIEDVVEAILGRETYNSTRSGHVTVRLTEAVKGRVKSLGFNRHKIVVQTLLSSVNGQSFEIASRCLWNAETDNYTTVTYQNSSLFAVVSVYGLYFE